MAVFEARISHLSQTSPHSPEQSVETSPYAFFDRLPTLKESASLLIAEAMRRAEGNQTLAARLLGISRTGLNKRLHQDIEIGGVQSSPCDANHGIANPEKPSS